MEIIAKISHSDQLLLIWYLAFVRCMVNAFWFSVWTKFYWIFFKIFLLHLSLCNSCDCTTERIQLRPDFSSSVPNECRSSFIVHFNFTFWNCAVNGSNIACRKLKIFTNYASLCRVSVKLRRKSKWNRTEWMNVNEISGFSLFAQFASVITKKLFFLSHWSFVRSVSVVDIAWNITLQRIFSYIFFRNIFSELAPFYWLRNGF